MREYRLLTLALLCALPAALPLPLQAQEPEGGEARIVTSVEALPELNRPRARGRERVASALSELPEGYALAVELGTFYDFGHSASSHEQEPFVRAIAPVNPDGARHGLEHAFAHNSQSAVQITPWKNGQKHGTEVFYNVNPHYKAAEVSWEQGRIQGVRRTFYPDGSLQSETPFADNQAHGVAKSYAANGTLTRVSTMREGERDGELIDYWPETGNQRRVLHYDNGTVQGTVREFYPDGSLRREIPFVDDMMHGEEKRYREDGEPDRSQFWIRGDLVTRSEFELRFRQ